MDLNKLVADIVKDAVADIIKAQEKPIIRGYEQLAEFLDVSVATAERYTQIINFPRHRIGKTTFYIKDEVIDYIRRTR